MKKIFLFFVTLFIINAAFAQEAAEMINKANEAMKNRQYAEAFELYDNAMKNLGDVQVDASINFNIGFAAMQADKNEAALTYFDKAIEAGANVPKAWEYKGTVYNKMKDAAKALECFEKAIETSEEDTGALSFNSAVLAFRLENFEKTVKYFDKAIASNFRPEDAYFNKAAALKRMGNDELYEATLVEANTKFPTDQKIAGALANAYVLKGNDLYTGGAAIINAANQKVTDGAFTTADAAYTTELDKAKVEFKKAMEVLEKAIKLDPKNANAQKLIDACKQVL